jgi:predicted transcriptional regulator
MLKEERKKSSQTSRPAKKTGFYKKFYLSLENGKIDIQISTLFKIFEEGLGKK